MARRTKAKRYTARQRAEALKVIEVDGLADAVRTLKIPKRTLADWANAAGLRTGDPSKTDASRKMLEAKVAKQRQELRQRLLDKASDLLGRMDKEHQQFMTSKEGPVEVRYDVATSGDVKNYAIALAVLIDKFRLESGEHTDYSKHDGEAVRHEVERKVDDLAKRRSQKTG